MNRMTSVAIKVSLAALCILVFGYTSWADDFIYANNYNFGGLDNIWQIDLTTGNIITNQYSVATGNGRGVVDVNNVLYITTADTGQVFAFNTSTSVLSTAFTVSGASGLASITIMARISGSETIPARIRPFSTARAEPSCKP